MLTDEERRALERRIEDGKLAEQTLRYEVAKGAVRTSGALLVAEHEGFMAIYVRGDNTLSVIEPPGKAVTLDIFIALKKIARKALTDKNIRKSIEALRQGVNGSDELNGLGQHRIMRDGRLVSTMRFW